MKIRCFHPLLFAIMPIAMIIASNPHGFVLGQALFPALCMLAITVALWAILFFFFREPCRPAAFLSVGIVFFFGYTSLFDLVFRLHGVLFPTGHLKQSTFGIGLLLALGLIELLLFLKKDLKKITTFFNGFGIAILVVLATQAGFTQVHHDWTDAPAGLQKYFPPQESEAAAPLEPGSDTLPDIYWILPDAYAAEDILRNSYGFDNTPFLSSLRQRGFHICKSTSNYPYTIYSVPATFNLDYLPGTYRPAAQVKDYIVENRAARMLKAQGYAIVTMTMRMAVADTLIVPQSEKNGIDVLYALAEMTVLREIITVKGVCLGKSATAARRYINSSFASIPTACRYAKSPKFVFLYLPTPHWPFLFRPDGSPISIGDYIKKSRKELYCDQISYINTKILAGVDSILKNSRKPPVIVIQADHGHETERPISKQNDLFLKERFRMLNALYLPDRDSALFYTNITPINTWRTIFSHYCGIPLPRLPDRCFYAVSDIPPFTYRDETTIAQYR